MTAKPDKPDLSTIVVPELNNERSNNSIRWTVLILLCCQNAGHALLTRYSRGILKENYSFTEVVIVGEFFKLFVSAYLSLVDRSETDAQGSGLAKLFWLVRNCSKIILLVILYAISNLLSYYALARVDASAYTVLLQLKILTTAAFAVWILNRNISAAKWRALVLLVIGCVLVASPAYNQPVECVEAGEVEATTLVDGSKDLQFGIIDTVLGFAAILLMNTISGFASIYFENMLKSGAKVTIWERNFQLAFCSIWILSLVVVWEMQQSSRVELFKGWTINTWLIMLIQACGGLLVAATLKYADSVLKTLATSGSIVISAVLGYFLLGGDLDVFIGLGCVSTILAICNYTFE